MAANQSQHQFIEEMGQLMVGWGLPRTTGRLYGCLLLQTDPASLDDVAVQLEVAKSGISVAMRQLVALGLARGAGQRGSRRVLYRAQYDLEAIMAAPNAQVLSLVERLRQGALASPSGPVRDRLTEMATQVQDWLKAIRELIARVPERRRA